MSKFGKSVTFLSENSLAVIAGDGNLPRLICEEFRKLNLKTWFFYPSSVRSKILQHRNQIIFDPVNLEKLFENLEKRSIRNVVFAGKITRQAVNHLGQATKNDIFHKEIYPFLHETDNKILQRIGDLFEAKGFNIVGVLDLLPGLTASKGILTSKKPSEQDLQDISMAVEYHKYLSRADIGQSLVVSSGLCLAVETLPGTDAMLNFVKVSKCQNFLSQCSNSGLLYKAPKTNQDMRFDIPVIGEKTIKKVREANLQGIALKKNKVILLDKERILQLANCLGLFIIME